MSERSRNDERCMDVGSRSSPRLPFLVSLELEHLNASSPMHVVRLDSLHPFFTAQPSNSDLDEVNCQARRQISGARASQGHRFQTPRQPNYLKSLQFPVSVIGCPRFGPLRPKKRRYLKSCHTFLSLVRFLTTTPPPPPPPPPTHPARISFSFLRPLQHVHSIYAKRNASLATPFTLLHCCPDLGP